MIGHTHTSLPQNLTVGNIGGQLEVTSHKSAFENSSKITFIQFIYRENCSK